MSRRSLGVLPEVLPKVTAPGLWEATAHISHSSQGKGCQGFPTRPIKGTTRAIGSIRAYWAALAPLAFALMVYMNSPTWMLGGLSKQTNNGGLMGVYWRGRKGILCRLAKSTQHPGKSNIVFGRI